MMAKRKFSSGDWVRHKLGGPIMQIIRYEIDCQATRNEIISEQDVLCYWFEIGKRRTIIIDQRTLTQSQLLECLKN